MDKTNLSYSTRIGKTTFVVRIKQSETAKNTLDTLFHNLCTHDVLGGFSTSDKFNLEKIQKTS